MNDVLIVGGGLTGLLAARELALAGAKVCVLERGELGRESSWAGGGIISPLYPWRYPDAVNYLAHWSQSQYESLTDELKAETGIDPEFVRSGLMILSPDDANEARTWQTRFAAPMEEIDAAHAGALESGLACAANGFYLPQVGQVRNPRLLQSLVAYLNKLGVSFKTQTTVLGMDVGPQGIQGVKTDSGQESAETVVVAGGAWSAQLLEGLGPALNIEPVKGQMLLYKARPGVVKHIILADGHYVIPRRDGRVLVGSTMERVGFDKTPTEAAAKELGSAALKIVPELANYPIERHWAGLRPGSSEGIPYIGEHPTIRGLFVSAGHFRNGVVMGPASARLLGDIMLQRDPIIDPSHYRFGLSD